METRQAWSDTKGPSVFYAYERDELALWSQQWQDWDAAWTRVLREHGRSVPEASAREWCEHRIALLRQELIASKQGPSPLDVTQWWVARQTRRGGGGRGWSARLCTLPRALSKWWFSLEFTRTWRLERMQWIEAKYGFIEDELRRHQFIAGTGATEVQRAMEHIGVQAVATAMDTFHCAILEWRRTRLVGAGSGPGPGPIPDWDEPKCASLLWDIECHVGTTKPSAEEWARCTLQAEVSSLTWRQAQPFNADEVVDRIRSRYDTFTETLRRTLQDYLAQKLPSVFRDLQCAQRHVDAAVWRAVTSMRRRVLTPAVVSLSHWIGHRLDEVATREGVDMWRQHQLQIAADRASVRMVQEMLQGMTRMGTVQAYGMTDLREPFNEPKFQASMRQQDDFVREAVARAVTSAQEAVLIAIQMGGTTPSMHMPGGRFSTHGGA